MERRSPGRSFQPPYHLRSSAVPFVFARNKTVAAADRYSAGAGRACRRMNPSSSNGGTIVSIINR
jgi:hypothetical protein